MNKRPRPKNPKASVIVCTHNRVELLEKCLESIVKSDYKNFEVVVVDDHSTDGTAKYLKELAIKDKRFRIYTHTKNTNIAQARNTGIKNSKSNIIIFTDDDCEVAKSWIGEMINSFMSEKVDFVIGNVIYNKPGYRGNFPERLISNSNGKFPMGCNIAYKKSVFKAIGGFDTKNFSDYHEDREMAIRAIKYGYRFTINRKAIVYHQKTFWNNKSLLKSAKAVSAWPKLKRLHPEHYLAFPAHFIKRGVLIHPEDYLYLIFYPIIIPVVLVRYLRNGNRNLALLFIKWPAFFILRRYYIYKTSVRYKSWML